MPYREDRIYGPPGTGKTTTLGKWIGRAARKFGSERIMVASFTKAAAAEIGSRKVPVPASNVGTLHALAYRGLGVHGQQIADTPEGIEDWNLQALPEWHLSGGREDEEDDLQPRGKTDGDRLYMAVQAKRGRMIREDLWNVEERSFARAWEKWKGATGRLDFTDMISRAIEEVASPIPNGAAVGFFDEAQDFTRLELTLARKWGEGMDYVVLAGDDDQTIYAFKGAEPDAFLDPPIPESQEHVLPQSYRVPRRIQSLAERWIRQVSRRKEKEYRPRDVEGYARTIENRATWKNAEPIADLAGRLADEGRTVMILASAGYMLTPTLKALRTAGIPFHNPYRKRAYHYNPLQTDGRGVSSAARILAYFRPSADHWGDEARLYLGRELHQIAEVLLSKGNLKHGAKTQLKAVANGIDADREFDWEEVLEFFEEAAVWEGLVLPTTDWILEHATKSRRSGLEFPARILDERGVEALRTDPKVVVGTIHSVKGGEADDVILLPDLSYSAARAWEGTRTGRDSILRTFYVGMTRAREGLWVPRPAGAATGLHSLVSTLGG